MSNNFGFSTSADEVAEFFSDHIKGKTILITGASLGGLGAEAAQVIAKHGPGLIILACRKKESADETIQKIKAATPTSNLRPLILDLASLDSVRAAAQEINRYSEPVDILINNAGIMATDYFLTKDGFEGQFGTNHLGPFLFTNLILPKLLASTTGEPRIINISSRGHRLCPVVFEDVGFDNGNKYHRYWAYGQSKTANILFAKELSNRYGSKGLLAFSLHPGAIQTNLTKHIKSTDQVGSQEMLTYDGEDFLAEKRLWKNIEQGTATHLVAAFDPALKNHNGSYLQDCQLANDIVKPYAILDANAKALWELSEKMVGQPFD
jgi:NAD(P)-dependent dehydrogenase (short-subunit alcohol dehydrogenase family)